MRRAGARGASRTLSVLALLFALLAAHGTACAATPAGAHAAEHGGSAVSAGDVGHATAVDVLPSLDADSSLPASALVTVCVVVLLVVLGVRWLRVHRPLRRGPPWSAGPAVRAPVALRLRPPSRPPSLSALGLLRL